MSRKITAQTRIAGVVGHPVRHSLSPIIHNAWIEAAGIDAVYLAFEPPPERFEAFVDGLRGGVVLGLNVTIPFKERALALADVADQAAQGAGAANLLIFEPDGTIKAESTDGLGLIVSLARAGFRSSAERVIVGGQGGQTATGHAVILGAGGAARAAAMTLLEAGAPGVRIVNRTLERALAIAALDPRISAHAWDEAPKAMKGAGIIINATSLGMLGQPPLELKLDTAPTTAVVMDMVYRPLNTELLRAAEARGHPTANGLEMLIGQAVPSFMAMFETPPPPEVDAWALCEAALAARA